MLVGIKLGKNQVLNEESQFYSYWETKALYIYKQLISNWIMHKKKESSLFKSLKNQNAFKKKGNKLLKSLTSLPTHSLHSPLCHMHGDNLMKNQLKIERTRMISSEYALNYKESNYPNCKKKPLGEYKSHKESIKSAKILLNSAFDACS